MAYYPLATEFAAIYKLTSPDAAVTAVFNDPTDPNYVGAMTEVSGIDSADIRENGQDLIEADGGAHGSFYFSRRAIVLNARVFGHGTPLERALRLDKARRASLALRSDAILTWKPSWHASVPASDWVEMRVPVRRQGRYIEAGAWVKDLTIPLVSEQAVIESNTLRTSTGGSAGAAVGPLENRGNWPAFPKLRISAAVNVVDPTVSDGTRVFRTTGLTLTAGETVEFDMLRHTGKFTASGTRNGQSATQYINFSTTAWPYLIAAGNTTFTPSGGTLTVEYRDTWA